MESETPAAPGSTVNPILLVHRALRGRYLLAVALGLMLAVPGAIIGYKLLPPVYTSTGVVTIDPTRPVLLYENEINKSITAFESFVRSQASTLESPRVMQDAAKKLAERGLLPADPATWVRLQRATRVSVPRASREIYVEVTMTDAELAKDAAEAILSSYEVFADEEASSNWTNQESALRTIVSTATRDRDLALARARELAESQNTVDLDRLRFSVQEQIEALDRQILALEIEQPALRNPSTEDQEAVTEVRELTPEDFAPFDTTMASLLAQERTVQQKMDSLLARVTPRHPDYLTAGDELAAVQERIDTRMVELKTDGIDPATTVPGIGGMRERHDALVAIREERIARSKELGTVALQIQSFEAEAATAQEKLDRASQRLDSLTTERQNSTEGRIRIAQRAEVPFRPSEDKRYPLAAVGAIGGMGFSLAAFAVYGLLHPRYRFVADLEDEVAAPPVLGLVPHVEDGRIEADEAAQAGVHQIRSLLESVTLAEGARVIVITSATAAEGKSTLAAALAASMARAGRRTLLIDADLIGRGVTSRLSARRLAGLTDRVVSVQDNGQIHEVEGRKNLDLMPAGVAPGFEPEELSSHAMEELLSPLRTRYEAIVIDTGPILGSLEANAVVPLADQIVLVVSRGQNTRLVKVAVDRLHRFHAGRIGLVFNRAARVDIERSTSAASISVRSRAASRPAAEQASAMSASA
jgi:capsular exopolysaccharide synthesis family protein